MTGCSNNGPSIDPRCEDPAFADANPTICKNFTRLVIVPESSVIEPGATVTYAVYLRAGSKEMLLERGVTFSVSNVGVATINEDGIATGVIPGITTITATWNGKIAHAQLEVVANCADVANDYVILIDNSKSMTQAAYTASSKLAYSKMTAATFSGSVNYDKDRVAVYRFNSSAAKVVDFQTSASPVQAGIGSIASSTSKTDIAEAIRTVSDYFVAQGTTGKKVIILFSDGENSEGDDPIPSAREFKDSGGIIIVVATRSWGTYFETLLRISSTGYFLSAHEETEGDLAITLGSLKSLVCGGSCSPDAGTYPKAKLNYDGFVNWNVTSGRVDLIGLGLWDVRPGNGLYVDLQGTSEYSGEDFGLGQLTSKVEYDFVDGKQYRFTIYVAGSLHGPPNGTAGEWTIRVRVGDGVDEEITITTGLHPFTEHTFNWTQAGNHTGPIIIEQSEKSGHPNVGTCVDEITLRNVTDDVVMLYDNFDTENPTTIDPEESYSYFGCLETAPEAQVADPTPPTPTMVE